jgi:hypothetical protein
LDVDAVEHSAAGEPPAGAKAVDPILIGTLVVTLGRSAADLVSVVRMVQDWVGTRPARTVKLQLDGDTIEITDASSRDKQRMIDAWIERHAEPA